MRRVLFILTILLSSITYAQNDSLRTIEIQPDSVCFSAEQVLRIDKEIRTMQLQLMYSEQMLFEYDKQLKNYEKALALDSMLIYNQNQKLRLLEENNRLLVEQVKLLKPKWYEEPILNFAAGVILTLGVGFAL